MRIALVTREFPPETSWGGIGSFYSGFARALSGAGHEVEVFCQSLSTTRSSFEGAVLVHRVVVRSDLTGPEIPDRTGGNSDLGVFVYSLATGMLAAVKARHTVLPFDIIEGHEHLGINALINAAEPCGAVTVTRYHGAHYSLAKRGVVDWPLSEWVRILEKQSIHAAHLRIAPSSFINTVVQADFQAPPAEAVIPHFLGDNVQRVANDAPRENVLLFVGRLDLRLKRPDLAVAAFQTLAYEFPDWHLHLIGADSSSSGGETSWEHCRKLIPVGLESRTRYLGQLSLEEVQTAFRSAKLLIAPSSFEAFSMVVLEAIQNGCVPVVASGTGAVDIVQDEDLIFTNGDVDVLVDRLRRLMISEQVLAEKRQKCAARIDSAFSARHLLESNERVFAAAAEKLRMDARVAVRRRLHRKGFTGLAKTGRLFRNFTRNPRRRTLEVLPNLKMYLQRQVSLFASFVANSSFRPLIPNIAISLGSRILDRLLGRPNSKGNRGRSDQGPLGDASP